MLLRPAPPALLVPGPLLPTALCLLVEVEAGVSARALFLGLPVCPVLFAMIEPGSLRICLWQGKRCQGQQWLRGLIIQLLPDISGAVSFPLSMCLSIPSFMLVMRVILCCPCSAEQGRQGSLMYPLASTAGAPLHIPLPSPAPSMGSVGLGGAGRADPAGWATVEAAALALGLVAGARAGWLCWAWLGSCTGGSSAGLGGAARCRGGWVVLCLAGAGSVLPGLAGLSHTRGGGVGFGNVGLVLLGWRGQCRRGTGWDWFCNRDLSAKRLLSSSEDRWVE